MVLVLPLHAEFAVHRDDVLEPRAEILQLRGDRHFQIVAEVGEPVATDATRGGRHWGNRGVA